MGGWRKYHVRGIAASVLRDTTFVIAAGPFSLDVIMVLSHCPELLLPNRSGPCLLYLGDEKE